MLIVFSRLHAALIEGRPFDFLFFSSTKLPATTVACSFGIIGDCVGVYTI